MSNISGSQTNVQYAFEDSDAYDQAIGSHSASDEDFVAFGQGVTSDVSESKGAERVYGQGSRNAQSSPELNYEGSITINGVLNNVYWLLGVLGANADAGSGPSSWTHTYTEADSLPSATIRRPHKFTVNQYEQFIGCRMDSATINLAVNSNVLFTIENKFRKSSVVDGVLSFSLDTQAPFTFTGGTLEFPSGTQIAKVQSCELNVVNTLQKVPEAGTKFAADYVATKREHNINNLAIAITDFTLFKKIMYNTDGTDSAMDDIDTGTFPSLVLNFTNADGHTIVATLANFKVNERTLPGNPEEITTLTTSGWCESLTSVVYTNATEDAPTEATNVS